VNFELKSQQRRFSEDSHETMIVTGVTDELESAIQIRSEVFSDVYDVQSEVGRYVCSRDVLGAGMAI